MGEAQVHLLQKYLELLQHWNRTVNLTSLPLAGFPDSTLDRLIAEPLAAARLVDDSADADWFDLGSGGGSPALPLKIARPALRLTMVESRGRKSTFLREAIRVLGLEDAAVLTERLERLGSSRAGTADLVTVRAVRMDDGLFAAAAALLREGGRLFLFAAATSGWKALAAAAGLAQASETTLPGSGSRLLVLRRGRPDPDFGPG